MSEAYNAWRAINGAGDHPANADWGITGALEIRLTEADPDAYGGLAGGDRPNPRAISNVVSHQTEETETHEGFSDMLWSWGQFVDHDLDITGESEDAAPIAVPTGDPDFDPLGTGEATIGFHRSNHTDIGGERAHPNEITSYLDASMVYGSSEDQHAAIRGDGGKMLIDEDGFLPKDSAGQYMGGDVRSGENVGLTSLHTVFAREHNRIVDELAERDPSLSDEALYTLARRVVETEIQKITYDEFLPKILGEGALGDYAGCGADVNPTVSVEFSTAAFRFGHTLLSPTIQRLAENGGDAADALELREAFFNPTVFAETGVDPILRGLADGKSQAYDPMLVEDVRSFLFGQPGAGGFDLASLNIQRGRDHGLQSYNDMREALGLDRKASFAEISSNPDIAARLEEAYGDVDLIDAWVGGLAEDSFGDGLVGELFHLIIADQFERVRAGDKYWGEAHPLSEVAQGIGLDTLTGVITANTGVEVMQEDVFLSYDRKGGGDGDDTVIGSQDRDLLTGGDGNDTLYGRDHDDYLDGGDGYDTLNGGAGDDVLHGQDGGDSIRGASGNDEAFGGGGHDWIAGGNGDDWIEGGAGHDELFGQIGDDAIHGGDGFDLMYGGHGQDYLHGGADGDKLFGNHGEDHLYGGAGEDFLYGGSNNDVLDGGAGNDRVYGQQGDDELSGGDGRDILRGGDGNDRLEGGTGHDVLRGDSGHDAYVFKGVFGYDRIRGFEDGDTLEFHGLTLEDLHISSGDNVTISAGDQGSVKLLGVHADDLDHGALVFLDA